MTNDERNGQGREGERGGKGSYYLVHYLHVCESHDQKHLTCRYQLGCIL
jgi:hypothetical protein